jgi:virginiamycin A acetyltransferase
MSIIIDPTAMIDPDARIYDSIRGTKIEIGAHSMIAAYVVMRPVGGLGDIVVGQHCYINPHCVFFSGNGIRLGNDVLLAPGVCVVPTNHAIADRNRPIRLQGFMPSKGGVVIEDDVWIGANVTILDGSRIGTGSVVAAGAIVGHEIPAYEIWGGIPARKLRDR